MGGPAPRAWEVSMRPRRSSDVVVRPLNFTVRRPMTSSVLAYAGTSILALLLVLVLSTLRLHTRLLKRLRSQHHLLWVDLGCPTLTSVLMAGSRAPEFTADDRLTYRGWLSNKGFRDINDPEVEMLGVQLQRLWLSILAWLCGVLLLIAGARYFSYI